MSYTEIVKKYEIISKSTSYSIDILGKLEGDLQKIFPEKNLEFTIVTTGSFGRLEASKESDIDLFIFCKKESEKHYILYKKEEIETCIKKYIHKKAGDTGTFGVDAVDVFDNILKNIGGGDDTNKSLTRRMLFLLEGKAIYNKNIFNSYKKTLITKYLNSSSEGKLDKYLLNDVIRYYRTITTDFQHKVDAGGKSWGIRNIKLRYSRKLLYFAGVMAIAHASETQQDITKRTQEISNSLDIPPLERIYNISHGKAKPELIENIFCQYEFFLSCISDPKKRASLNDIKDKSDRLKSPLYNQLSEKSTEFTDNLYKLLNNVFEKNNQIHTSLIF